MKYILLVILPLVYDLFSKKIAFYAGLAEVKNRGISFGLAQGHVGIISAFNILISALIVLLIFKMKKEKPLLACGLSLLLGGTLANLSERLYLGYVTDWILCPLSGYLIKGGLYFNIADVFICLGALLMLLQYYLVSNTYLKEQIS